VNVFLDSDCLHVYPAGISIYLMRLLGEFVKVPGRVNAFLGQATVRPARFKRVKRVVVEQGLQVPFSHIYLPGRVAGCVPRLARLLSWPRLPAMQVVHAPGTYVSGWLASQNAPLVLTIHDLVFLRHPEFAERVDAATKTRNLPAAVGSASAIITVSEFTKGEVQELLGVPAERIFVTPLAPQWTAQPPTEEQAASALARHGLKAGGYFLSVGTLSPRKNFGTLLEAFARMREKNPEAALVIVGAEGWHVAELAARLRAGVPGVTWIQHCSETELRALYQSARAFFLVSWYEGFGIPIVEAMSSGCPVCCATGSSMDEVAAGAGVLVPPGEAGAIASAMARLWEDSSLREKLRLAGLKRAESFSWDRTAEQTLQVYERVSRRS
jgi:alpha-1,3-rhamnosyl/mannosyltransferase